MLKESILLVFLVFMLGGTNGNFAQRIKRNSDGSGGVTVLTGDHEPGYTDIYEIIENEEEDTSRHFFKFFKTINLSGRFVLAIYHVTCYQCSGTQVIIFLWKLSPFLYNLPPPVWV
jgi:hypothetical protein